MPDYGELLKEGMRRLEAAGVEEFRVDAELLFMDIFKCSRTALFLDRKRAAAPDLEAQYYEALTRREAGEPVQYITGTQEFMGMEFLVDPSVLIPRLDTEVLVDEALSRVSKPGNDLQLLDMCCGSGAIGIAMAGELPGALVTACDISPEALATAEKNAAHNNVSDRMTFRRTNMFREMDGANAFAAGAFDMILCNPPYIATATITTLSREVRDHEPAGALDGGADGLDFYRLISKDAGPHLKTGGLLVLEIGHDQAASVTSLLRSENAWCNVICIKDLAGNDRVIIAERAE